MLEKYLNELYKQIPKEKIYINEPMKNHTSFKIGGPAECYIKASKIEEIENVLKIANKNKIPIHIIGNGSNILVKDEGIKGIVLKIDLQSINIQETPNHINVQVESGVPLAKLAYIMLNNEITGLEFAAGIPGTIGGAIRMNAGAHGKEMQDIVYSTKYIDLSGNIHTILNKEHQFNYRTSIFAKKNYIILQANLKLKHGDKEQIKQKMDEYSKWRKENQPLEYANAGSTFKRGNNFITAELIDKCGLKGYKIGGAQVSTKHAGFIVNTGEATAQDVLKLIEYVKKEVYKKFEKVIELEIEVL